MKLCYCGISRTHKVISLEVTEAEISGIYQGAVCNSRKLRTKSVPKVASTLKCRGKLYKPSYNEGDGG